MRRRTLFDLASHYADTRSLSQSHRLQFLSRASQLQTYAQARTPRQILRERVINGYLRQYAATRKPVTARTARVDILTLWSHAAHLGHASLTTFRRYYDARLIGGHTITPPAL